MSTQPAPNPWTSPGPLDDLLTELEQTLATYRAQGIDVDARLLAFAQRCLRGQRWMRELGPWVSNDADPNTWQRLDPHAQTSELAVWFQRSGWWGTYRGDLLQRGPFATRNEAMAAVDAAASPACIFDPALPPETEEPRPRPVERALAYARGAPNTRVALVTADRERDHSWLRDALRLPDGHRLGEYRLEEQWELPSSLTFLGWVQHLKLRRMPRPFTAIVVGCEVSREMELELVRQEREFGTNVDWLHRGSPGTRPAGQEERP